MNERQLIVDQLDRKIKHLKSLSEVTAPTTGWVYAIRKALNMSLKQLGKKMSMTPQSVRDMESREKNGNVSLNVLRQVGSALNMRFVYAFIPKNYTLKKMIEERAVELATEIVKRTAVSMSLEDQKPSNQQLKKAVQEKAEEIADEIPKYLWD